MRRILAAVGSLLVLEMLWGCGTPITSISAVDKPSVTVVPSGTAIKVGDYKLTGELPDGWEIPLSGENKGHILKRGKSVGLIEIVGYYGEPSGIPNHSSIVRSEDIVSGLGKGNLSLLERSMPAASPDQKTWIEIYSLIPIKDQNLAFSVWVDTNNVDLNNDLTAIKGILGGLVC
ncbi:hypothetical protein JCM15765_44220 [Paradesulfitobacterium aromaticivorans]